MGTEACMVNFQISTSLINHFSYYIDFHLEKSERHNWYTSIKVSSVPQAKLGGLRINTQVCPAAVKR